MTVGSPVVRVGEVAPDFTLPDSARNQVTLSSFRGDRAALLVFYPFAFSRTCTGELCQLRDDLATFQNERVQVLAISTDPVHSLAAYAKAEGYAFPLLSDFWPHGDVAKRYGVFFEKSGMALRGTFLIDVTGVVTFAEVNQPGEARDQAGWKRAVDALARPRVGEQ